MPLDSLQSSIPGIAYDGSRPDTSVLRDRTPPKADTPEIASGVAKTQARSGGPCSKTGLPVAGNATRQFALEAPSDVAAAHIRDEGLRNAVARQIAQARVSRLQPARAQVRHSNIVLVTTWPKAQVAATSVARALHREGTIPRPECAIVPFGADAMVIDSAFARLRDEGSSVLLLDARIFTDDVPGCAVGSRATDLAHRLVPVMRDNPQTLVILAGNEAVLERAFRAEPRLESHIASSVTLQIDTYGALEGIDNLALREIASRDIRMSRDTRQPGPQIGVFLKASPAEACTAAAQYAAALNEVELVSSAETFTLAHGDDVGVLQSMFARVGTQSSAVLVVEARMLTEDLSACAATSTAARMYGELLSFMSDHGGVRVLLHGDEAQLSHLRAADPRMTSRVQFTIPL